jgi:soluble lytic murein transglycosylase-like protein
MKSRRLAAFSLFFCAPLSFAGPKIDYNAPYVEKPKVYKYRVDRTATFSDVAPIKRPYVVMDFSCFACNPDSKIDWDATKLFRKEYSDAIDLAAEKYKVDSALVRAIIHAESGFNARARSRKGAKGLMQLMPATAREVGVKDAYAPEQNIYGGVQYLASMLAQFNDDTKLAAAAYNAGPAAVEKYSGVPPYAETQAYVKRVHILHRRYQAKERE